MKRKNLFYVISLCFALLMLSPQVRGLTKEYLSVADSTLEEDWPNRNGGVMLTC